MFFTLIIAIVGFFAFSGAFYNVDKSYNKCSNKIEELNRTLKNINK